MQVVGVGLFREENGEQDMASQWPSVSERTKTPNECEYLAVEIIEGHTAVVFKC